MISLLTRAALVAAALLTAQTSAAQSAAPRPRLVVHIAVDQLRPDYLTTWESQLTGGYQRLMTEGAFFANGYQDHANTETAPGHASMLSGRHPYSTGIIANAQGVETNDVPLVDFPGQGASPFRFRGTTLANWMQRVDPRTRVLSVSRKDRSAILPVASNARHTVMWYAPQAGRFTTSVYYADTLPTFVQRFNAERGVFQLAGKAWNLLLPESAYPEADSVATEGRTGTTFPHVLPADSMRAAAMIQNFPWIDSLTLALALRGVSAMELGGRSDRTDLLAVSLSATDGIGHRYGPDSRELHDQVLRVDQYLGAFIDSLYRLRGRENVIISFTSDHGATPPIGITSRWGDNARAISIPSATFRPIVADARAALRLLPTEPHIDARRGLGARRQTAPEIQLPSAPEAHLIEGALDRERRTAAFGQRRASRRTRPSTRSVGVMPRTSANVGAMSTVFTFVSNRRATNGPPRKATGTRASASCGEPCCPGSPVPTRLNGVRVTAASAICPGNDSWPGTNMRTMRRAITSRVVSACAKSAMRSTRITPGTRCIALMNWVTMGAGSKACAPGFVRSNQSTRSS